MNGIKTLSVEDIDGGNLILMANRSLNKVLRDALDPNKKATETRTVTVKIKIKPDEERDKAAVEYVCSETFAPHHAKTDSIRMAEHDGQIVARSANQTQSNDIQDFSN